MRKAYQKPLLYAESYELSQHIAACDIKLSSQSTMTCTGDAQQSSIFGPHKNLFTTYTNARSSSCTTHVEEYCYTNGISGFATFMS